MAPAQRTAICCRVDEWYAVPFLGVSVSGESNVLVGVA